MIRCGWCGKATVPAGRCSACGHEDPGRPWTQRAMDPPVLERPVGRPRVDASEAGRRLAAARAALGDSATTEAIAEFHDVDPRTVRHWRSKVSG